MDISIGSYKFRLEILIALIVVSWIMFGHMLCSCCRVNIFEAMTNNNKKQALYKNNVIRHSTTEGFTGANNSAMGPEFAETKTPDYIMNPSTWSMPTLAYSPGTTPDPGVKAIWDRPKQPIPLPEGELDMFATTPFKPECCPNAYSSSTGCACMTVDQYNFLKTRGANNVPYDIY